MERKAMILMLCMAATAAYAQTDGAGTATSSADSLRMDSIIHALPEVMVKGERPIVKVAGSKLTYDMPLLLKKESADNVYDALKLIPGVTDNNGSLTLAGNAFNVLINGKHHQMDAAQLNALLKSLPANRLKHAEVMYTTPARYEVRGASINLDIASDSSQPDGWQGELTGAWNQEHEEMWSEKAGLIYHKGKLDFSVNYQHNHGKTYGTTDETSLHHLDDGTTHDIETYEAQRSRDHEHLWRMGFDYAFTDNHRLSLSYTGNYGTEHAREDVTGNVMATNAYRTRKTMHDVMLDYQLPTGTKVNVEYTYYDTPSTQHLISTLPTGELHFDTDEHQRINRWKFHLGQEHSLAGGWGLNYGVRYSLTNDHSWQTFLPTGSNTAASPTNSYSRQNEDIVNIFAGTNGKIGEKLDFEVSLAAEYYHSPAWHQWNVYPTLSLTYMPNSGHMLLLNVSSDKRFPDYWTLQNFTSFSNGGYNEVVGNPSLKPSSNYQTQLVYVLHNKYQFVAWFQRFGNWLDSRLTVLGVWMKEKCSAFYDIPFNRDIAWVMVSLRNNFTLVPNHLYLNLDGMIRSKAHQAIYDLPSSGNVDLGLKYIFCKKRATLHVFCNDLFETSVIDPVIRFGNQNMKMDFSCYRQVGVSLVYRFGGYKDRSKEVDTARFKQ